MSLQQGVARFSELHAARAASMPVLAVHAAAGGPATSAAIEARDAAPQGHKAAHGAPEGDGGAESTKEPAGGAAQGLLQQGAAGLARAWEARPRLASSHAAVAAAASPGAADGKLPPAQQPVQRAAEASAASQGGAQADEAPKQAPPRAGDGGHLCVSPLQPVAEEEEGGARVRCPQVAVRLAVEESNLAGLSMFSRVGVHLDVLGGDVAGSGRGAGSTPPKAILPEQATASASRGASGFQLPSLGGLLRAPVWVAQGMAHGGAAVSAAGGLPSDQPAVQTPAAAQPAEQSSAGQASAPVVPAEAVAQPAAQPVHAEPARAAGPVSLQLLVLGPCDGPGGGQGVGPCRVALQVSEAAAGGGAGTGAGRLGGISGLFRSSRGAPAKQEQSQDQDTAAKPVGEEHTASPGAAETSTNAESEDSQAAGSAGAPAKPQQQQQHQAGWGLAGAVGSLYGYVSHAAEATLRSAQGGNAHQQQAPALDPPGTPVSGGDHFGGMRAALAGAGGAPDQAEPAPSEADAAAGAELVHRLRTAAAAVLQVGLRFCIGNAVSQVAPNPERRPLVRALLHAHVAAACVDRHALCCGTS